MLEEGRHGASRTSTCGPSRTTGNAPAQQLLAAVFEIRDRQWRGIGAIPRSGFGLRPEFAAYDAELRFDVAGLTGPGVAACASRARSCAD